MVANKLLVSALATLASLVVVNAGPCKPKTYATDTTSASSASASFSSETSTAPLATIETSTANTGSGTTVTTTENGTTMTVSVSAASTTTADSETSTEASESDTTAVANSETTAVTSSAEATTVVSSTEITSVATSTEGSSTVAETTATTTTADAGPTVLMNGNFELGDVYPWLTTRNPVVSLGSDEPFEGRFYGKLEYPAGPTTAYNNYLYQTIDWNLLKEGSYGLSAMLRVDKASTNIYDDGCNSMAVGCTYGDPNELNYVPGSFVTTNTDPAVDQWFELATVCSLDEQELMNYASVTVVIGFSCARSRAGVDAVKFQEIL